MKKKTVVLKPNNGKGNPYIDIVRKCLEAEGYEVITPRMTLLPRYLFRRIYVANFNWYENVERQNRYLTLCTVARRKLMVFYLKVIRRSRIVVTVHNRKNHHAVDSLYSENMLAWLMNQSDAIVYLCDRTKDYIDELSSSYGYPTVSNKIFKIRIPNYVNEYVHSSENEFWKISEKKDDDCFELAYFGTISKYKNIEIFESLANKIQGKKIHLTIAGGGNPEYVAELKKRLSLKVNVSFQYGFIPEDKIWGFIKGADCVVLPYNKDSVLNSSAVILALSVGTNVICPANGTTDEFYDGLIYTYDYDNEENHIDALYEKVMEAYGDFSTKRDYFDTRISELNSIVKDEYSFENTKEKYKELYLLLTQ